MSNLIKWNWFYGDLYWSKDEARNHEDVHNVLCDNPIELDWNKIIWNTLRELIFARANFHVLGAYCKN